MKIKAFAAGILVGVIMATSVTAFGLVLGSGRVEAYLQDTNASIIVDGKYLDLPADTHILNYEGRIYTPARLVAESLGCTVEWEDARRAVIIESPEPEVIIKHETLEVPTASYFPLPQRRVKDNMTVTINEYDKSKYNFGVYFDFLNNSGSVVTINVRNAYVEYEGEKYDYKNASHGMETDSIPEDRLVENATINFEPIPEEAKHVKLVIPVEFRGRYENKTDFKYEFNIELD